MLGNLFSQINSLIEYFHGNSFGIKKQSYPLYFWFEKELEECSDKHKLNELLTKLDSRLGDAGFRKMHARVYGFLPGTYTLIVYTPRITRDYFPQINKNGKSCSKEYLLKLDLCTFVLQAIEYSN